MSPRSSSAALAANAALAGNALAALNVANAWRPFDRHGQASMASFASGLPTSELAVPYLGALAGLNAVATRRGAFHGPTGALGATLAAGTAATYAAMIRAGRAAGPIYEDALREALGPDYRERIVRPTFPGPDAAVARAPGLVRMARIRRRFALDADLSYGPARTSNLLDIWHRADLPRDGRAPVLIQMPGGAWIMGNKQGQAYPLMSNLAESGWICVAISYRLGPKYTWPAQIVDVKRAISWVREHIGAYGGDPDFLALTGGSAGGHLSSLAALTPNDPQWQPGFEDADTSVAAAAPFYGAYDWTDRDRVGNRGLISLLQHRVVKQRLTEAPEVFDAASPMSRINAGAPPFLLSHGVNDSLIPIEVGRLFAQRLRAVSANPVVFAELPRAQHAFDVFGSPRAAAAAEAVGRFLGVVYGEHLTRRDAGS